MVRPKLQAAQRGQAEGEHIEWRRLDQRVVPIAAHKLPRRVVQDVTLQRPRLSQRGFLFVWSALLNAVEDLQWGRA